MSFDAQETLVTEHLTFPPLSLIDDIINTVNELVYKSISGLENFLNGLPESLIPAEEIESGMHKCETLLENAVDRNFDGMELYVLRNCTNIPEDLLNYIQLKHHIGLDFSTDDTAEVEEELQKAKKTLTASKRVKAMMAREIALNQQKLALLESHTQQLQFLEDVARANDVGSVKDSVGFLREQIRGLQSNLDDAAKLAPVLDLGLDVDERSKYIEEVLLSTIKTGSFEQETAEASKVGTVEDLQRATAIIKGQNNT